MRGPKRRRQQRGRSREAATAARVELKSYPADEAGRLPADTTRGFPHGLQVHADVSEKAESTPVIAHRLSLVMSQLAAHGATSVASGGGRQADGWRRSPLGGEGREHYYLWWRRRGESPGAPGSAAEEILLRAIHAGEGSPRLETEAEPGDYLLIDDALGLEATAGAWPWTPEQIDFALGTETVRLIEGRPGAGKTTALWLAIDAREEETILYLTWSRALVNTAREHFAAFAPASTTVQALEYREFLETAAGAAIATDERDAAKAAIRESLAESREMQTELLETELRGVMYGRAAGGRFGETPAAAAGEPPRLARLQPDEYRDERARQWRNETAALETVAERLSRISPETAARAFPELAAAATAARKLRAGEVPSKLAGVNRIVIDELQDLTLVELWPVLELFKEIDRRGRTPRLLAAGDAAQTVRASGFDWSRYSAAIGHELATRPASFALETSARAPARIAEVLERLRGRYTEIEKGQRPTRQQPAAGGDESLQADLAHVSLTDGEEARNTVKRLAAEPLVAILQPDPEPAAWIDAETAALTIDPEGAKGLEYRTVCVLDAGRMLARIEGKTGRNEKRRGRVGAAARMLLDRLNVACSRATGQLVVLDVDDGTNDRTTELLGEEAAEYAADEIVALVADDDLTPAARARLYLAEAEVLADEQWERAWQRAEQATRLLGPPELPGTVADTADRAEIRTRALALAATRLFEHYHAGTIPAYESLAMTVEIDGPEPGTDAYGVYDLEKGVMVGLSQVASTGNPAQGFFVLLELLRELEEITTESGFWPRNALERWGPLLAPRMQDHADEATTAKLVTEWDARAWLRVLRHSADSEDLAVKCGATAFNRIMETRRKTASAEERAVLLVEAENVLRQSAYPNTEAKATMLEERERFREAAAWYRMAGKAEDEVRCLRLAGAWEEAREKSAAEDGAANADLKWLAELQRHADHRPEGLTERLANPELDRLFDVVREIWPTSADS